MSAASPALTWLRERHAAARGGDPAEAEQSIIRLGLNFPISLYIVGATLWDGVLEPREIVYLGVTWSMFLLACGHFVWMLVRPGANPLRRYLAVWFDNGAVVLGMMLLGATGLLLFFLLPWVCLGNGFRYGRWYLHYSQAVALLMLTPVLLFDSYWSAQPFLGSGLVLVLVAIPFYVSLLLARLQAARAEADAANLSKSRFLAAASHDLRQPMQALSMYAGILQERHTDPDAARVVRGVQLSVRTLEQLFDGVLDVSRIEAGVVRASVAAFKLRPLLERVVELERPIALLKGLELRAVPTAVCVLSDPILLERMLQNLVTNAIRYTERGGILIGARRAGGGHVRLEVVDSGIGIPRQEQQRIFDEYYQLQGASAQGLGLGLPIVKSLAGLLGHAVSVRSTPGRGSVFAIELERAAPPAPAQRPAPAPAARLEGVKVVLVDDDAEVRRSIGLQLESWGCRAFAGATVAEVGDELRATGATPDALIVDYRLADAMTGIVAIERLRASFGRSVPALLITGTPGLQTAADAAGVPLAIKPVPPGKLRAFLSQAVTP